MIRTTFFITKGEITNLYISSLQFALTLFAGSSLLAHIPWQPSTDGYDYE